MNPNDDSVLSTPHSALSSPFPLYPGELALLIGHPGAGKSLLSLDLATRITTNSDLPPAPFTPAPDDPDLPPPCALLLSAENPHLDFHLACFGANPARLLLPDPNTTTLFPAPYSPRGTKRNPLPADSSLLQFLHSHDHINIRLIILDPLPAFLGPITASPSTLLSQLKPLLHFASRRHIPILGISHLAKSLRRADPSHLPIGSLGYSSLARSILLLTQATPPLETRNPNLETRTSPFLSTQSSALSTRLLIPIKNNFAPCHQAFSFTLTNRPPLPFPSCPTPIPPQLTWNPNSIPAGCHRFAEANPCLNAAQNERIEIEQSKLDLAIDFLQSTLKDGPLPSKTVHRLAQDLPLSKHTLDRARLRLKIRPHFQNNQWLLSLPCHRRPADQPPM